MNRTQMRFFVFHIFAELQSSGWWNGVGETRIIAENTYARWILELIASAALLSSDLTQKSNFSFIRRQDAEYLHFIASINFPRLLITAIVKRDLIFYESRSSIIKDMLGQWTWTFEFYVLLNETNSFCGLI